MDNMNGSLLYDVASLLPGFLLLTLSIIGITALESNAEKLNKSLYMFFSPLLSIVLVVSLIFQLLVLKWIFDTRQKILDEKKKISALHVPARLTGKKAIEDYKFKYFLKEDHKAFAYSPEGPYGYCFNQVTVEDAKQCALKYCDSYQKENPFSCEIISVDGK